MLNLGGKVAPPAAIPIGKLLNRSAPLFSRAKLFVGGLLYDTNEIALKDAFSQHGDVIEAKVICHPVTGIRVCQVLFRTEAAAALEKMSNEVLDGRNMRVHYAKRG